MPSLLTPVTEKDKDAAITAIILHASPRRDFFLMTWLSVAMASLGILLDSTVVLIGSMLIAPMLYPILSLALGFSLGDQPLMGRSIGTLVKSTLISIIASFVIGVFFITNDISSGTIIHAVTGHELSLIYAIVAGISGFAAAYALVRPGLNDALPGVAVSVSLVPPLAMAGIGLSRFSLPIIGSALLLFAVNIAGIVLSAMLAFSLLQLVTKQKVAERVVESEEAVIAKEAKTVKPANG